MSTSSEHQDATVSWIHARLTDQALDDHNAIIRLDTQLVDHESAHANSHRQEESARRDAYTELQRRLDTLDKGLTDALDRVAGCVPREVYEASQQELASRAEEVSRVVAERLPREVFDAYVKDQGGREETAARTLNTLSSVGLGERTGGDRQLQVGERNRNLILVLAAVAAVAVSLFVGLRSRNVTPNPLPVTPVTTIAH